MAKRKLVKWAIRDDRDKSGLYTDNNIPLLYDSEEMVHSAWGDGGEYVRVEMTYQLKDDSGLCGA
jgi:hypothetical protein